MAFKRCKEMLADDISAIPGEGQHVCSQPVVLSLFDVLHEVPHLLDLMPSKSLAALLAVSQMHHRQIRGHVRRIWLPGQDHIQALLKSTWPSLIAWQLNVDTWYIEDISMGNTSDAPSSLLAKAHMARDYCVFVGKGFNITGLSSAAIQGFVAINWPTLTILDLRFSHIDVATIAHLEAASWPCLLKLTLSFNGLTYEAFQQLCNFSSSGSSNGGGSRYTHSESRCCWPELDTLDVSRNNMCHGSPPMPTQLRWLTWQNMGWTCHLKALDLSHNNMTALALKHLTSMSWPCLEVLLLKHTRIGVNAATNLVGGLWPRLGDLNVQGVAIGSSALQVLLEAPWRQTFCVRVTVRLKDIAALEQLVEMRLQQKLEVRRIGALNPDMLLDVDAEHLSAGTTRWQAEMTPVGA